MKVLVTGAKGQLGQDLLYHLKSFPWDVYGFGREELDITNSKKVEEIVSSLQPDIVIHSAAYTQVDQAETDAKTAYEINGVGTKNIALAATNVGAKFCYVSTDYVFDGNKNSPYKPDDVTNPQTVYGETKLAGEKYTLQYSEKFFILRTSWVFGLYGNNFVKTMLRLARENNELGVVHDQVGSPTYTADLAKFIIQLVQKDRYGVYHVTNDGECSWYEFAQEIFKQADKNVNLNALTTEQFPRPAIRPKYSVLDKGMIEDNGFDLLPHWKTAIKEFLKVLKEQDKEI